MKVVYFNENKRDKLRIFQDKYQLIRIPLYEATSQVGETLYLEENNFILGIISIVKNAFHPKFERIYFAIRDKNNEVMKLLYESLVAKRSEKDSLLQVMFNESEISEQQLFIKEYGFSLVVTCECPEIDVQQSLNLFHNGDLPDEFRMVRYSQLTHNEKSMLRIFRLNGYVKTHLWSPPVNIDDDIWHETDLSPKSEDISWAVFKGKRLILCSDAHIGEGDIWLGWGWHEDECEDLLIEIWSKVLYQHLIYCQLSKYRLFGEFDSTDKYAQMKSKLLCHLTKDTTLIYQQKPRAK